MLTGIIYGWTYLNGRIHGRMENHATRPELNGKDCHTSRVLSIGLHEGQRFAHTQSGSKYRLVD